MRILNDNWIKDRRTLSDYQQLCRLFDEQDARCVDCKQQTPAVRELWMGIEKASPVQGEPLLPINLYKTIGTISTRRTVGVYCFTVNISTENADNFSFDYIYGQWYTIYIFIIRGNLNLAKIDATVRRETVYIAAWVAVFSLLMQAVFLLIGRWNLPVLWGNLLGAATAVGNFLLMGLTVQRAVTKEKKDASRLIQLSQSGRLILQGLVLVLAATVDAFNLWAAAIPLLMPRAAIALRPLFDRKNGGDTL